MRTLGKNRSGFSRLPLVTALLGCLYGPMALAQAQAPAPTAAEEKAEAAKKKEAAKADTPVLERVTVTGSLLKTLQYDSASPVQVITADISATIGKA